MTLLCVLQTLQRGLDKAAAMELQHMRDRKHVFKKGQPSSSGQQQQPSSKKAAATAGTKHKQRSKLSFAEPEDEEQ